VFMRINVKQTPAAVLALSYTDKPLQLKTTQEHGQWHIRVAYNRFVTPLSARPLYNGRAERGVFTSLLVRRLSCASLGRRAGILFLAPVAALPTPQSLANRQWPWVVVVAAAAAAGALDLPHHSSTPRQNEPSSVSSSSDSEVVVSGAEMFEG